MSLPKHVFRAGEFEWRLEPGYVDGMRRAARVFVGEDGLTRAHADGALRQIAEVACLPGGVGEALAMPDIHHGYGFPIGGVAAFDAGEGIVSPGGVGYDINCGVRALVTPLTVGEVRAKVDDLADALFREVPCGVGSHTRESFSDAVLAEVLKNGARWAVGIGRGVDGDLQACESEGALEGADPRAVSARAKERGRNQLGTLGSGNHFLEVQRVAEVYDSAVAAEWGVEAEDRVVVMIHCGSRGLGHQVCDDYLRSLKAGGGVWPNRELVYARIDSSSGGRYLAAMTAAANFAWANRQLITHQVRGVFGRLFGVRPEDLRQIYDVAHNVAKFEVHAVDGGVRRVLVHRKGATRAFPAGHPDLPERFRSLGQPVLLPGDMGTASYLLLGVPGVLEKSFGSTGHGAGRMMSRKEAVRSLRGRRVVEELRERGVTVRWEGRNTLFEEHPSAYKDVHEVVAVCEGAGLARRIVRLEPLAVVKG
jgi:tRNA-splicing ligase RtcB